MFFRNYEIRFWKPRSSSFCRIFDLNCEVYGSACINQKVNIFWFDFRQNRHILDMVLFFWRILTNFSHIFPKSWKQILEAKIKFILQNIWPKVWALWFCLYWSIIKIFLVRFLAFFMKIEIRIYQSSMIAN